MSRKIHTRTKIVLMAYSNYTLPKFNIGLPFLHLLLHHEGTIGSLVSSDFIIYIERKRGEIAALLIHYGGIWDHPKLGNGS